MTAYVDNIVLKCSVSWMLLKVCGYVLGWNYNNLARWREEYCDANLDIKFQQQDTDTMFLTVYTDNTFASTDFMNDVISKVHDAICKYQREYVIDCECQMTVRRDGCRIVNTYTDGRCTNVKKEKELTNQPIYNINSDFPELV